MEQPLDLAVIGNCTTACLINRQEDMVWSCWPNFDSSPLFSALVDQDGSGAYDTGYWGFEVEGLATSEQSYRGNSAILETVLTDRQGQSIRITDFMPRYRHHGRIFRDGMIIRKIEPLYGAPRIRCTFRPTQNYGTGPCDLHTSSNHISFSDGEHNWRLTTDASPTYIVSGEWFAASRPITFILGPDEELQGDMTHTANNLLERTDDYWQGFTRHLHVPAEWQQAVIRAAITLKLCTMEETGAVLAALTTSIPESAGSIRNWDYRYCWLRDSFFTVQALNRVNITDTTEMYLDFIMNIVADYDGGDIQPLFTIHHGKEIEEYKAATLSGFLGHQPVRVGNAAYSQIQNDSYGSIILALMQMFLDERLARRADQHVFEMLERLGHRAIEVWDKPDAGIWEFRGSKDVRTYSAVTCWMATDRLARLAGYLDLPDRAAFWRGHADDVGQQILDRAWNADQGHFVETLGGDHLDASLLLLHNFGFIASDDPRYVATVQAIGRDLMKDDLLFRYRIEDDFGEPDTAFTICAFWYVEALDAIGERQEVRRIFESLLSHRNHVGLLSEDIDFKTGQLWGNFPQTYSMVGIIQCAHRLSRKWREIL